MKKFLLVALVLLMAVPSAWAFDNTTVTMWSKSDIARVGIFRQEGGGGTTFVYLHFTSPKNGYNGVYFYDFDSYGEALDLAYLLARGKIKGAEHYDDTTLRRATMGGKSVYVVARWFFK